MADLQRGSAAAPVEQGPQLPFGTASRLNQIVAMRTAPAAQPQAEPPAGDQGSALVSPPEAPFVPRTDQEKALYGPTKRPGESVLAGAAQALSGAPPDYNSSDLVALTNAAALPNASPQIQAMAVTLANRLAASRG